MGEHAVISAGGDPLDRYSEDELLEILGPSDAVDRHRRVVTPSSNGATPVSVSLADVQPEPVTWLWVSRIPRGKLTILDGDPGLGKSTLALDLAARVTTGRAFPDGAPAGAPAGVVLLTAEDGLADTVRPRLDAMGGNPSRVIALTAVTDERGAISPLVLPDHLDALRVAIEQVHAVLVIVDPFTAYLASYVNSRIDHDVRRTLAPLAALAEETEVAMILIRHLNKMSGGPALYRGGGSIGIVAAARAGLLVAEDPDDLSRRVLAVVKANLAPRAPSLAYRIESTDNGVARIVWVGESAHTATVLLAVPDEPEERSAVQDAKEWLADLLRDGPKPAAEVYAAAKQAGHPQRTVQRAKAQLGVRSEKLGSGSWVWKIANLPDLATFDGWFLTTPNKEKELTEDRQDRQPGKDRHAWRPSTVGPGIEPEVPRDVAET